MSFNVLSAHDLYDRVKARCGAAASGRPPFTLILGSGFSYGIIPTTAQIVQEDLPWWLWCQRAEAGGPVPKDYHDRKEAAFAVPAKAEAQEFWKRVSAAYQSVMKRPLPLDAAGLPFGESIGEAYRFALSAACSHGLDSPHQVRRYFGDIIRRIGRRLNPAHLFLASLVAEKPRLFGTIFTTNFDPLLQRSLQLVNAPYYVSDRPDTMQHADDDDIADAVHVVHAHGSIYRYLLLNSPAEIEEYANRNQGHLREYFRTHAVVIVGFSGWDDAITRALAGVDRFAHNLYWTDRGTDPDKSNLTPKAKDILSRHPNAFYVPIGSADELLVQLHQHLTGHSLPKFFHEPILVAQDQLDLCNLTGVKVHLGVGRADPPSTPGAVGAAGVAEKLDLGEQVKAVRVRLADAQKVFSGQMANDPVALRAVLRAVEARRRLADASDLYFGEKYAAALVPLEFAIRHGQHLEPTELAQALLRRGFILWRRRHAGDVRRAIDDYTAVIGMPGVPAELRAKARFNRGVLYYKRRQVGDAGRAIADYTAVIGAADAPADLRVEARLNRGAAYGARARANDVRRAVVDFTAVIGTADAPAEQRAKARRNRGVTYAGRGRAGDVGRAIADYTAVIDMPDAPAEQRAKALINRGVAYDQRGNAGDLVRSVKDFSSVRDATDSPDEQKAMATQQLDQLDRKKHHSPHGPRKRGARRRARKMTK